MWANESEKEKDGKTLFQVVHLVFEKAIDDPTWSEMYARLCRKMMEQISPKVQDDGIKNLEGNSIAGGHLCRKYLLNMCQEEFERGWVNIEATAGAADECYATKRRGLGVIKFMGELFKLQMLTERIMHECVKRLFGNVKNSEKEDMEAICTLLTTVGQMLDTNKARAHMDVYFSRMKELMKSPNVSSRMQFMLQVFQFLIPSEVDTDCIFRKSSNCASGNGGRETPSQLQSQSPRFTKRFVPISSKSLICSHI